MRVLRVARFAARFGFAIAPETLALMRAMVANGEVDALVAERVWQELARGLMEDAPSRMFAALRECGALAKVLPEVDALFGVPQSPEHHPEIDTGVHVMQTVDFAASAGMPLEARYALLAHDLGKGTTPREEWPRHVGHEERSVALARALSERLRAPNECRDLATIAARWHGDIHRALELRPATLLKVLEGADAFRRPERFALLLEVCRADRQSRPGFGERPYSQADVFRKALAAAQAVDAGAIAQACPEPQRIGERVHQARAEAIRAALGSE